VAPSATQSKFIRAAEGVAKPNKSAPVDLKALLVSIHLAILNRAKTAGNPSIDVLGRLAVLKFIRTELHGQFCQDSGTVPHEGESLEGVRQES